jgi:protein associated with RNAse G/E
VSFKLVKLESFKYPDTPRYFQPGAVVSEMPDHLTIFHPAGAPSWGWSSKRVNRLTHHCLSVLFPDRDYNIVLFWNSDWTFSSYYVNVALPVKWDGEICSYVDLDLDVLYIIQASRRRPGDYSAPGVYVLDRDEYEERKVLLNYPPEIMERSEKALVEVLRQIEIGAFPFDHSLLDWRPDPALLRLADLPDSAAAWHL